MWSGAGYEKDFIGVFSTYDKAQQWIDSKKYDEYEILWCKLDEVFKDI